MALLAAVFASGCGPKNDPIDEPGDESGSTTTGEQPDLTTTSTGGSSSSTDTPTTSATSTGGETTGEIDPICDGFCDKLVECELDGAFDGCPCYDLESFGPKCQAGWQMTADCFEAATCDELDVDEGPCWNSFQATYEQCIAGEDDCDVYILGGTDEPPGECTFGEECISMPEKIVKCVADTCTCTIDDMAVGTCPADDVCSDFVAVEAWIAECCGP